MGVELKRSSIPRDVVEKVTRQSVELYEKSTGKKADRKVYENFRKDVVKGAERINRDGGHK